MALKVHVLHQRTFIDLFCGCGGLSLGFVRAGFRCIDAVEVDPDAHATHASNFDTLCISDEPRDISDVSPSEYRDHGITGADINVILGGPPCQPFTRVGRAKLRAVAQQANAHIHDERVTFYEHYLRFVDELRPEAFLMENVPDLCRFNGRNIAEEIAITAADLGYIVRYTLLNSAWYGVPQMRERVIILGLRKDLGVVPTFPSRTHRINLPRGYITSRDPEKTVPVLPPHNFFAGIPKEIARPSPALTVHEAIGDLPAIREHLEHMQARRGTRRFSTPLKYSVLPMNSYQRLMRSWPGVHQVTPPLDHVIRYTPRDYFTFREMRPGDQYPEAYAIAIRRFEAALHREEQITGRRPRKGTRRWEELKLAIVPPYDPKKFPNKWQKLAAEEPAHTLTAHLGKDTYSHIHPDDAQARMISVREAARLQSFPDGFRFAGSMNPAFRQIGNSVPPLLAHALAESLRSQLSRTRSNQIRSGRNDYGPADEVEIAV